MIYGNFIKNEILRKKYYIIFPLASILGDLKILANFTCIWEAKPPLTREALRAREDARKQIAAKIDELKRNVVSFLCELGAPGFSDESKFTFGSVNKFLKTILKSHKVISKHCKALNKQNIGNMWPLWKVELEKCGGH